MGKCMIVFVTLLISVPTSLFAGYQLAKTKFLKNFHARFSRKKKNLDYEKDLFDSLEKYFLEEKPFLDPALGVSDVARHLCTNRTYLSEAVNLFAGVSFPAYVNLYRIDYSINLFKDNPDLKVNEIASMCGFNSPSAFNAQFKLVMNIPPGQWFKRNRGKIRLRK